LTRLPDERTALAVKVAGSPNSPRVWHDMEDRQHGLAEEVRVLYVALTRARERLILLARKPRGRQPWLAALAPWGYDVELPPGDGDAIGGGQVLHRLLEPPAQERREQEASLQAHPGAVQDYEAATDALRDAAREPFLAPSAAEGAWESPRSVSGGETAEPGVGLVLGRVLHRLLEVWDGADETSFDAALVPLAREEARREGLQAATVEAATRQIGAAFLASDLARLFGARTKVGREVPLLLRDGEGRLYRGSIDLLYQDEDGTLVVADYKTDDENDEVALGKRYGEQLRIYAEAAQQALGLTLPPRRELWMLRSGQRIVLT